MIRRLWSCLFKHPRAPLLVFSTGAGPCSQRQDQDRLIIELAVTDREEDWATHALAMENLLRWTRQNTVLSTDNHSGFCVCGGQRPRMFFPSPPFLSPPRLGGMHQPRYSLSSRKRGPWSWQ